MEGKRLRHALVLAVFVAGLAGPAGAATPASPKLPRVAAIKGTVKDMCTGRPVPGFTASLSDPLGGLLAPSKTSSTSFTFESVSEPTYRLLLAAPGYQPLDDPADAEDGPALAMPSGAAQPGPSQSGEKNPGPVGLSDGGFVAAGLRVAALLMPAAGCSGPPKTLSQPDVIGKVIDAATGQPVPTAAVALTSPHPGPAEVPATIPLDANGRLEILSIRQKVAEDPLGQPRDAGNLVVSNDGYTPITAGVAAPPPFSAPNGGALDVGLSVVVALKSSINQPPVIVSTALSATQMQSGDTITLNQVSYDPDPLDNAFLQVAWLSSTLNPNCTFSPVPPHGLNTDVTCTGSGTASLTLTVGDLHGHVTKKVHFVTVIAAPSP